MSTACTRRCVRVAWNSLARRRSPKTEAGRPAWRETPRGITSSSSTTASRSAREPLELLRLPPRLGANHHVHDRRPPARHRLVEGGLQLVRLLHEVAVAAERFDHLL